MTSSRTISPCRRVIASVTICALLAATTTGCTSDEASPPPADTVTIAVRAANWAGVLVDVMDEEMPRSELYRAAIAYVLDDGTVTTDAAAALASSGFSVDVGDGARVTLRRDGDLFEIVDAPPPADPRIPPVRTLRLDGTIATFHVGEQAWRGRAADVEVRLEGLPPEFAEDETAAFAIHLVVAPHLDHPQAAWLAVLAIVGVGWLAFCGGAMARCALDICECYRGYRVTCLGFTVTSNDGDWSVEFEGPECECVGSRIPGCEES